MDFTVSSLAVRFGKEARSRTRIVLARQWKSVLIGHVSWDASTTWEWGGEASDGLLALVLPGGVPARLGGDDATVTAPFFLMDGRSELVTWADAGACTMLWLPRQAIIELAGQDFAVPRAIVETDLTQGLRALVDVLSRAPQTVVTSPVGKYVLENLLIESVWGFILESTDVVRRTGRRGSLYERARSLIFLNASSPSYTVTTMATDLAVSARQLQRAFAARGATPRASLRQARVQLALSMLKDPGYDDLLSLDQIARHSGFADAGTLRIALSREGLPSPRRLRQRGAVDAPVRERIPGPAARPVEAELLPRA
ncbi:AraC-like DNA-binding protein [Microbacterium resistens]|uniref:AraC-like DNA-binding protein n=1 Tax=Microbacterium resistens TaxID=156977 RepID=A0ABU1SDP6_9MICO|nr:helix-turn-helix domain-containing protein [Microbacterium resistens]MDR6867008.1 AraC-like DNA-binding protein [Microbacterium resistens]